MAHQARDLENPTIPGANLVESHAVRVLNGRVVACLARIYAVNQELELRKLGRAHAGAKAVADYTDLVDDPIIEAAKEHKTRLLEDGATTISPEPVSPSSQNFSLARTTNDKPKKAGCVIA